MPVALAAAALLCLAAPGYATVRIPAERFTLVWRHSIEKVDWEEDYAIVGSRLHLSEARIRGSGAGMEPPDDARLVDGVYVYHPRQPWFDGLDLARSSYVEDYRLCIGGACRPMSAWIPVAAGSTHVTPCAAASDDGL